MLTPTMRAVLRARLGQLTDGARHLAERAAVIGRPFSIDLMVSATGSDERELVEHVDELWRRRIIRDQGLTYDFTHDKLRAVALEMVSPARRRQLHRAIAEAIAVEFHNDIDAASPQRAAHYDQAGMVEPAIAAYRVAGSRAVAVSALEEAVTMFRRALALLADLPPSSGRDAVEVDIRIALGSPSSSLRSRVTAPRVHTNSTSERFRFAASFTDPWTRRSSAVLASPGFKAAASTIAMILPGASSTTRVRIRSPEPRAAIFSE